MTYLGGFAQLVHDEPPPNLMRIDKLGCRLIPAWFDDLMLHVDREAGRLTRNNQPLRLAVFVDRKQ
jgi:hypothetical protein